VKAEFQNFYSETSTNPPGRYKSFVIKKDPSGERLRALTHLLDLQDIRYGTLNQERTINGYHYQKGSNAKLKAEAGDLVVNAYQPKGLLAQILLEPHSELEDSVTYDITAWALPYAYGLDAIASDQKIDHVEGAWSKETAPNTVSDGYAYLIPHTDLNTVKYVSALLSKDISVRVLPKQVVYNGETFEAGTAVVTRADNRKKGSTLMSVLRSIQGQIPAEVHTIHTGFADAGPDLGSGQIDLVKKPKVLTLSGEGVSTNAFGQIKWYFDRVIDYKLSVVDVNRLGRINLDKYNTLILPEGWYRLSSGNLSTISSWVRKGGKLIAIGSANRKLIDQEGFGLKRYATEGEKNADKKANEAADLAARYNHYSESERRSISDYVPGAIFQLHVDDTHPLGFGMGDTYYSLRTSSTTFPLMVDADNVIYHPKENGKVIGFAGSKIKKRLNDSAAFIVESKGRGNIIYMADNPLFRGFWYNGLFLFSNALFLVN